MSLAQTLYDCLLRPGGLTCDLVAAMTSVQPVLTESSAPVGTAEMRPQALRALPQDTQTPDVLRTSNIERFVWEFLANRTFAGEPHELKDGKGEPIGCGIDEHRCPGDEVRANQPTHHCWQLTCACFTRGAVLVSQIADLLKRHSSTTA